MGVSQSKRDYKSKGSKFKNRALSNRNLSLSVMKRNKSLAKQMLFKLAISKQHHFATFVNYDFNQYYEEESNSSSSDGSDGNE